MLFFSMRFNARNARQASLFRRRSNERDILLVGLRVPVQLQVVAVLLAVEVVDFISEFPAVHGQCLENAVLFPCRGEAEEVGMFHFLLCFWMYSFRTTEGSLTPCLSQSRVEFMEKWGSPVRSGTQRHHYDPAGGNAATVPEAPTQMETRIRRGNPAGG